MAASDSHVYICMLTRNDFWCVSRWLAGAYASSSNHLDQHKQPVLIQDHKMKWLDIGTTFPLISVMCG